jgi:hypothetical protein
MSQWFNRSDVTGMAVQVTTQSNGAEWSGSPTRSTIQLKAQGASYSNNPAYLRYLIIAEVVEIFMLAQGAQGRWFQGNNEGSKGEGLSRFLSSQFLEQNGFLGTGIDADYAVADLWLNSSRQDFVNNAPDDNGYDATNGCTTLFIYYLFHQLGFSINQIVGAGAPTLAEVYRILTGDTGDPFPHFKLLLDKAFPSQTTSAVPGPNFDDPWPLMEISTTIVPNVIGDNSLRAQVKIRNANLVPSFFPHILNSEVESQGPHGGEVVEKGSTVRCHMVEGKPVVVPDVIGLDSRTARRAIGDAELVARFSGPLTNSKVQSQSPFGGEVAPRGSVVRLQMVRIEPEPPFE